MQAAGFHKRFEQPSLARLQDRGGHSADLVQVVQVEVDGPERQPQALHPAAPLRTAGQRRGCRQGGGRQGHVRGASQVDNGPHAWAQAQLQS